MFDVPLDPSTSLTGTFDVEAFVARYPRGGHLVKGMFCNRLVDTLGASFAELQAQLIAPPRGGRYLPFKDYPQADYSRIVVASAVHRFPELDLREATRRIARDDFATFAASTMGKITLSLVGDPHAALLRMPEVFARVAPGPQLKTEERDRNTVRMVITQFFGLVEYMLGQLEGIVMSYSQMPRTRISKIGPEAFVFEIEHR